MSSSQLLSWSLLLLLLANATAALETTTVTEPEQRCIDFELKQIDAITRLGNSSLFVASGGRYWILETNEIPKLSTARSVEDLISVFDEPSGGENENETEKVEKKISLDAAVSIQTQALNGECVAANQLVLISTLNGLPLVTVHENGSYYSTANTSYFEMFRVANTIDWTRKIDAMTFFNNITIIFQGDSYTSIQCVRGKWKQILHKKLLEVFPGLEEGRSVDSVLIQSVAEQPTFDLTNALLFYGHEYMECRTTGVDPCEGPYNVMSEYFDVHHYCSNMRHFGSTNPLLLAIISILIIFFFILIALILYFTVKPDHFTYFVNRKLGDNYSREQLSYEALKLQCDGAGNNIECKSVTNGKS